jgi:outer membrane immunogenic protein
MSPQRRCAAALAFSALVRIASARTDLPWDGAYFGGQLGDALGNTCNSWTLTGGVPTPEVTSDFNHQDCSKSGTLGGGLQFGENFQSGRLVWGVGADLDYLHTKTLTQSLKVSGANPPPPGIYAFSSKQSPNGFAVIGPRIGYGGDTWLPFVKAGALIAIGSRDSTLFYTPIGATKPSSSFDGGSASSTIGWVSGAGFELGLNGAWSIIAEFQHANLGKGATSRMNCNGSASTCAAFSGITIDSGQEGYRANIVRIGVTYWFDYW